MKFSQLNIAHWINKVYLPSSAAIFSPGEFQPNLQLIQRALPPSMAMENRRFQTRQVIGAAGNSLVTMVGPSIDDPRFWWVHGLDLSLLVAAPAVGYSAFLLMAKQGVAGQDCTLATQTHAANVLVARTSIRGSSSLQETGAQSGCGSFLLSPGYEIKGSTTQPPAGAGTLVLTAMFTEFLLGEEIPSVS